MTATIPRPLLRDAGQPGNAAVENVSPSVHRRPEEARRGGADAELYNLGITFTVYSDEKAIDRILPFDVIPRVLVGRRVARISRAA